MPVTIVRNTVVGPAATSQQTSTVGEPSVSINGTEALFTGNWYAAFSANGGATWTGLNPFTFFPAAAGGFCCDQTLIYIPKIQMHVWLLQYVQAAGTNVLRVAFKQNQLGTKAGWKWWDIVPANVNPSWSNQWFDYNHAAYSDDFLFVGTNMFQGNTFTRAVMFRIPLSAFKPPNQLTIERFVTTTNFSLRCVQGATSTMYFASHEGGTGTKLRVFAWPNNQAAVSSAVVTITGWNQGSPYGPVGPGASNFLGRCDGRITGGWLANGVLGFMWTADKQGTSRPFPYVRVVRINAGNFARIDEPDIWSGSMAFAYPDACPNDQGDIGVSLFAGGGTIHPAHCVGFRRATATAWTLVMTAKSTHSPTQPKWGDYLTCRRQSPAQREWVATGYRLNGGGGIANIEPHFVHFK
ncbi:MAG TPA: hypothetical protein VF079_06155 [Sphingomicrobium sp.]